MTIVKMPDKSVVIIAEAGLNHNGDLSRALEMVQVAKHAGADVIKFQTAVPDLVITPDAPKALYQMTGDQMKVSQLEMAQNLHLPLSDYARLRDVCVETGIEFMSSAFDEVSLDLLLGLEVKRLKVPSGEITNLPYLRRIGCANCPVILSSGMATLMEIGVALEVLEGSGLTRDHITVLHCNTEYPSPMKDVNLSAMHTIRDHFGVRVGYSDHTEGYEISLAAVALGACVIEKHFTLDRSLPGPDHQASLDPAELHLMIQAIRNIETAWGDGCKRPSESEERNIPVVRKSLVAKKPIYAGDTFTDENVIAKRPGNGISPMLWDEIIGQNAKRTFLPNEFIEL